MSGIVKVEIRGIDMARSNVHMATMSQHAHTKVRTNTVVYSSQVTLADIWTYTLSVYARLRLLLVVSLLSTLS
jgi:hypothetical protein